MRPETPCPTADQLRSLLDGTLDPANDPNVIAHAESCPDCQRQFDQWTTEQDVLAGRTPRLEHEANDPILRRILDGLKADPQDPNSGKTTVFYPDGGDGEPLSFLSPSTTRGAIGRFGFYDIDKVIGRGGMGVVLKGRDERLQRPVAVKVLSPSLAADGLARRRFLREARAAAAVIDDYVVTIHAVDEAGGLPYLVMQYVAGMSLQQKIDQDGPLELKEILRIGIQVAHGLAAAHKQGLVHRDIKPANILLENGVQRVKITDFGLARTADDASISTSGVVAGTPEYMSPEQARGEAIDPRTDLFSLGSVLYAMCTGRPAFRSNSTMSVLKRVCDEEPQPIDKINPEVPEWLVAVIRKLHAKKAEDRYQSAAEMAQVLEGHLAELQLPVRPTPKKDRHWEAIVLSSLVFAVLIVVTAFSLTRRHAPFPVTIPTLIDQSAASPPHSPHEINDSNREIAVFTAKLKAHPDDADVLHRRGYLYFEENNFDLALTDFEAAVRINPKHGDAHRDIGRVLALKSIELDRALSECDLGLELKPSFESYVVRGNVHMIRHEYDAAIADFNDSARLGAKTADVQFMLAAAMNGKGEREQAIAAYTKALEADPKHGGALLGRAIGLFELKKYEQSIADSTMAILLDRSDTALWECYKMRGLAYQALEHHAEALADFDETIRLNPSFPYTYYARGMSYAALNKHEEAILDYSKAIKLLPKDAYILRARSAVYTKLGEIAKAKADLELAEQIGP